MCLYCNDLQISESIRNQAKLTNILALLKGKAITGIIKTICLFTNREIPDFEMYSKVQDFGVISLKFICTHCNCEYRLFAETSGNYIGFFSPLHPLDKTLIPEKNPITSAQSLK